MIETNDNIATQAVAPGSTARAAAADRGVASSTTTPARDGRKALVLLAIAIGGTLLIYATPLNQWLNLEKAKQATAWVRDQGAWGPFVFAALTLVSVSLGAPRLLLAGVGGYLFGFWPGFLAAQFGTLGASILTFLWGRALGREYVSRRLGSRFERLSHVLDQIGRHGIVTNVLIRNIPVGNSFLMTLAMSVTPMPLRDFAIGTFLGTAPEAAICAYLCNSSGSGLMTRIAICGGLILVLALVSWFGLRRTRLAKSML